MTVRLIALLVYLLGAAAHPFGPPPVAKVSVSGSFVDVTWSAAKDDLAAVPGPVDAYLGEHMGVAQDGRACALVSVVDQRVRFRCPAPVSVIALTVTVLTDVNPNYRTVSTTPGGSGALHTNQEPTHELRFDGQLAALVGSDTVFPLALLVALVAGAFHACAPGHGKTLTAGYLVGGEGRARDALWLGVVVAVMHTVSVGVLAVGWWLLVDNAPDLGVVTRWLQLAAALTVLAVGVALLRKHLRHRGHGHGHGHGHRADLLSWRGLVTVGISGGLLPSPSAFLLLLTGLLTGRPWYALAMVAAFGLGMAVTLGGVGLAVLKGRDLISAAPRLRAWSLRLPLAAAALVVAGGLVTTALAAAELIS
ncbi:hypothetical protein ACIBG8_26640 [Nonomuraea sp. NPDC050556]|uniref:HoxN/HupN/NixA family nickel/cobalt transporter n=1 Tax=Nonomuraea sp. NPDC050556 TaxID=3364369 RepID=UPI0037ABA2AD